MKNNVWPSLSENYKNCRPHYRIVLANYEKNACSLHNPGSDVRQTLKNVSFAFPVLHNFILICHLTSCSVLFFVCICLSVLSVYVSVHMCVDTWRGHKGHLTSPRAVLTSSYDPADVGSIINDYLIICNF